VYKNSERSRVQIRRKEIIALFFIVMVEIIFVITNISFLSHLYKDGVKNSLKENVFIISNLIKEYDKKDYQQIFENSDMRFNIIGLNGKVIYDSRKYNEEGKLENHGNRREVLEVKNAGIGFDVRKREKK